MQVGLLNPRNTAAQISACFNAPITLAYLARRLKDVGIEAHCLDLNALGTSENVLLDMGFGGPEAIGISATSAQADGARRLIKLIRHHAPTMYIVCGGVDVTLFPQKYLEWGADAAVIEEADGNIGDIFEKQPKGIIMGARGKIGGRPLWENHSPQPWQYPGHPDPLALPEAHIMTTRGCPWRCDFCGSPYNKSRVRFREVDDVVDEIEWLADHGIKSIFAYDDDWVTKRHLPFLHSILERNPDILFRCQGRCDIDTKESAKALGELTKRGLKRVMWGVESTVQHVLDAVHKDLRVEQIEATLEAGKAAGLQNFAFLMIGMPEQTYEDAISTIETVRDWKEKGLLYNWQATFCTPMPGTPLEKRAADEGWLATYDPFQWYPRGTPWMSQAEASIALKALRGA